MKAHTTLLLAAALCASLPAVAEPPAALPPAAQAGASVPFAKGHPMPLLHSRAEMLVGRPLFIAPMFEEDEPAFRAALPDAYWQEKEGDGRIPAAIRNATVGDVLAHWEQFRVGFTLSQVDENDRADFERRDAGEVLPPCLGGGGTSTAAGGAGDDDIGAPRVGGA